jgi:hypothetical protein
MAIDQDMLEISKPYVLAGGSAVDQHEALRRRVAKLRKKKARIDKQIKELDAQAVLAWELHELHTTIRHALYSWTAEGTVDGLSKFKARRVFGDPEIAYTCIDSDHYFPPAKDRAEMFSPEWEAENL